MGDGKAISQSELERICEQWKTTSGITSQNTLKESGNFKTKSTIASPNDCFREASDEGGQEVCNNGEVDG